LSHPFFANAALLLFAIAFPWWLDLFLLPGVISAAGTVVSLPAALIGAFGLVQYFRSRYHT
jgi:hypothetical protein